MLEDREIEDVLDLIASTAAVLTGQPYAGVLLAKEDGSQLELRGHYGLPERYIRRLNEETPLLLGSDAAPGSNFGGPLAFRTGRLTVLHFDSEDLVSDDKTAPWAELAEEYDYISMASAPLSSQGRQLGTLNVMARQHIDFSHSEMALLEALATEAAAAIEIMQMRAVQRATIQELEQSDRMQQVLTKVALADEGLDPVTATLSKLTDLGVAVEDCVTGRVLSRAELEDPSQPGLDDALGVAREQLKDVVGEQAQGRTEVRIGSDALVTREPVVLGAETVARLWTFSRNPELTPIQGRVLERGAVIVALELLKQRDARAAEWRVRGELIDELMAARADEEERVFERARALGHDLAIPHTPIVVRPDVATGDGSAEGRSIDGGHGLLRIAAIVQAVAGGRASKPLIGTFAGAVVIIWPTEAGSPAEIADATRRYVSSKTSATVSVCIGESSSTMSAYTKSIRLALGAIRLLQSSGNRDRLVSLDELGIFRVLLAVDDEELLRDTARQVLGPLMDYDNERDSSLFETLTAYVDADLNVADTARTLHLHPNSLHYRVRRIQELLDVRLRDPDDLVRITFALAIRRLYST
jgi:sugar diacid utilization regulator/GAF domain-containing protein